MILPTATQVMGIATSINITPMIPPSRFGRHVSVCGPRSASAASAATSAGRASTSSVVFIASPIPSVVRLAQDDTRHPPKVGVTAIHVGYVFNT
jgi:hypothetical protein